jgi:hypothetical protein
MEQRLDARDGAFEVHRYADEAAARQAIQDREVYGAVVAGPSSATVLTASAASATVANLLTQAAGAAEAKQPEMQVLVKDVVPMPQAGTALPSLVFPLILAGSLVAMLSGLITGGSALRRIGTVVVGSVLAGAVTTLIVQGWLDIVGGNWFADAGAISLTILAVSAVVSGADALWGKTGSLVAALVMILLGNPFSGVGSAPELLPRPVGALGQLLPPGAGSNLLRSTGLFDGAGAGGHVLVLAAWATVGLGLLVAASVAAMRRRPATATALPARA